MQTTVRGIHHIAIATEDPVRLASFYTGVLGLSTLGEFRNDGRIRSVWLSTNDNTIVMLEKAGSADPAGPRTMDEKRTGLHLLAFGIPPENRGMWKETLRGHKVNVEQESPYSIYFRDFDGNLLALSHYPDRTTSDEG